MSQPRTTPARFARYLPEAGQLHLTVDGRPFDYWLAEVASPHGRGFRLSRFRSQGGEVHDCFLSADGGHHCDCVDHRGHDRCRHAEALAAVIAAGKLPAGEVAAW